MFEIIKEGTLINMSANGLNIIILEGQVKLAQISYENSSPWTGGVDFINFFKKHARRDFLTRLNACVFVSEKQFEARLKEHEISKKQLFSSSHSEAASSALKNIPSLSPWVGLNVLHVIQDSPLGVELINSYSFAADSLTCEWGYVLDFDAGFFEIYSGLNMDELNSTDRFYSLEKDALKLRTAGTYHPLKLVHKFPIDKLPSKQELLNLFSIKDEFLA